MMFTGRTTEDAKPTIAKKNSMNRSQIFYAGRPDSFADSLFSNVGNKNQNKNKRNDSSIGRDDIPDSFELSIVSRGRNQLCQMRNKTTIFE